MFCENFIPLVRDDRVVLSAFQTRSCYPEGKSRQSLAGEAWVVGKCQADEGCQSKAKSSICCTSKAVFITMPTPSAVKSERIY